MTTNVKDQVEKQEQEAKKEELKTCFIVMPISNADGYDSGHFNRVYDYIIKPACAAAGFKPSRADDTKHTNTIILDILDQIVKADMVLCDLSSKNPNVMYELGIRQAFNLPVVLIKDDATPRVFDTSALRDIEYDRALRIDNVNAVVARLTEAIKETYRMKDDDTHSLISLLNIQPATLPEKKEISPDTAIILEAIRTIKSAPPVRKKSNLLVWDEENNRTEEHKFNEISIEEMLLNGDYEIKHNVFGVGEAVSYNTENRDVTISFVKDQLKKKFEYPYSELYFTKRL